jgi:hypothetical protein
MQRGSKSNPKPKKPPQKKAVKSVPHLDLSDCERWNNLCAALAEDALLDETSPGSPDDVDRIRKRIAQISQQHTADMQELDRMEAEELTLQMWKESNSRIEQQKDNQDGAPRLRKM